MIRDRKSSRFVDAIDLPSIRTSPPLKCIKRSREFAKVVWTVVQSAAEHGLKRERTFPQPVLPTMPTFDPGLTVNVRPFKMSPASSSYRTAKSST